MPTKLDQIHKVMRREGWDKYTNDPADRGDPTKWGITEQTARSQGYTLDMRDMTQSVAERIYSRMYWDSMQLDMIESIDPTLAVYMFDYGVNSGTGMAAKTLQRLLNVLNDNERHYDDIDQDGVIGGQTINALQSFFATRGEEGIDLLRDAYNGMRIGYLVSISENKESQERFTYGWLKRVVHLSDE